MSLRLLSKNHHTLIFLICLIILFIFLRTYRLSSDLLIHFDQGLHALGSYRIWHDHQFKLLGHQTDVDGLFHGPFYYLLMAIPYALSGGNPFAASLFQILLEALSLPLFYLAVRRMFNQQTAMISLLFYSLSHGMIGYSRWLSNVTPILPLSNLLLFLLAYLDEIKPSIFAISSGLVVGLIAQLNAAIGFPLFFTIPFIVRKKIPLVLIPAYLLAVVLPAIPQMLFELRHGFVITKAFIKFSTGSGQGFSFPFVTIFNNLRVLVEEADKIIAYRLLLPVAAILLFSLYILLTKTKKTWLLFYLLLPVILYGLFGRGAIGFFYIYLFPPIIAIVINSLLHLPRLVSPISIALLIAINLFHNRLLLSPNPGLTPIGTHNLITLRDRLSIIDWMYQKADGKAFSYWVYTIPYYLQEPWDYQFLWYGQPHYGYLPEKTGSFSPGDLKTSKIFFAIYEPDWNNPNRLLTWQDEVNKNFKTIKDSFSSHDAYVDLYQL